MINKTSNIDITGTYQIFPIVSRLLNTQSAYCCFPAAAETYALALDLLGMPDDVHAEMPEPFAAAEDERIDPNDPEHK